MVGSDHPTHGRRPRPDGPSAPYRGVASSRGPRFSGRSVVGGLGLLALLLTIGIMAVLVGKVISGVSDRTSVPGGQTEPLPRPDKAVPDESETGAGLSAVDMARDVASAADRATLETALAAYEVISGVAATDQQELVDAGLLGQPIASQNVTIVDGTLVIEGIGDCLDE